MSIHTSSRKNTQWYGAVVPVRVRARAGGTSHDHRSGSSVREPTGGRLDAPTARAVMWGLLPSQRAVTRLTVRLLGLGVDCLVVGLARLAARGTVSALRLGVLAVGYACLGLAVAVPAVYWAAILAVGVGSLLGRRLLAGWRTVRAAVAAGPDGSLRPCGRASPRRRHRCRDELTAALSFSAPRVDRHSATPTDTATGPAALRLPRFGDIVQVTYVRRRVAWSDASCSLPVGGFDGESCGRSRRGGRSGD